MIVVPQIRAVAMALPRTREYLIRDRVKFRVGRIVYVSVAPDELTMGVSYPREEREELIAAEPEKFFPPIPSELRFHWVECRLDALDEQEMTELVTDAWRMVVPAGVARQHLGEP